MKKFLVLSFLVFSSSVVAQTIAIRAGNVIDTAKGSISKNQVIIVESGRIKSVGPGDIPPGAKVIDLSNEWVMPGLMDPNLIQLLSDPENLDPVVPEPYTSSALLAEEVLRRRDDPSLFESFCSVMNEMALSREYWMQETLGDLVEGLVHDEAFVARLRPNLNAQACEKLEVAMG